ncbi:patatin-like phospholipase family protein [Bdellovibrio sp. HCB2-146]|uniref:patatin-like phospholipase family protein n=1 Tax=Bdellovibrio sp. HCB2-146 TaxID=3394362 RepID=UPI0039BD5FB8
MNLRSWLQKNEFSLALSSGFFGFYAHCGFVKALYDSKCYPKEVSGSSAGAIIAGALASGLSPQEIEEIVIGFRKQDFWDPSLGWGFIRGQLFEDILHHHFIQDFSQAKLPLHISIFDIFKMKTVVARTGSTARAIRASCAVPLMFHPTMIENRPYWDGGLLDKAGMEGLNADAPILCHYLKSPGLITDLEYKFFKKKMHSNLKLVLLEDLSQCGPNLMHEGKAIIDEAYQKTQKKLDEAVSL